MEAASTDERERLLDPVDRISEVLFGLIMAVTIVGSLSIATAGQAEVRTVLIAALGCNVAWGLVDAVMYVVRTATERARLRTLAGRIRGADAGTGIRLIANALPEHLAPIVGPSDVENMRTRLLARPASGGSLLRPRDFLEAFGIFAMVVIATFPVVAPFLLTEEVAKAMNASRVVTLVMLAIAGAGLGRYAGYGRPWVAGMAMAAFGAVLILAVMALGG
jgi:VIT1/CCC1 family predicted Fe2+/Mn2+ transporter